MRKFTLTLLALTFAVFSFSQSQVRETKQTKVLKAIESKHLQSMHKSGLAVEDTLYYCASTVDNSIGTGGAATFGCFIKLPAAMLAAYTGKSILGVQIGIGDAANTSSLAVQILTDNTTYNGSNPAFSQNVTGYVDGWNDVVLGPPFAITGADLWVGYKLVAAGGYPAGCDATANNADGDLLYYGGWMNLSDIPVTGNWSIKVLVGTAEGCLQPGSLNATNITTTSADLTWVESGSATTWNLEWGTEGFSLGSGTAASGLTAQTHSISGLTAGTSYDFYVQADCGGGSQSAWTGPYTFLVPFCDASAACDYTINCEDAYGDGWNNAYVSVMQGGVEVATIQMTGGASSTETLSLCDGIATQFVFVSGSWDEEFGVSIVDPFGTTLATVATGTYPHDGSANGTIIYSFTSYCTPPACPNPSTLAAANVTTSGAQLSWTEMGSATAWNIQYGVAGFTLGTGTIVAASANPYTLSGLTAATTYGFYVQADCGGAQSDWVGPVTFSTACNALSVYPYSESFEGTFTPLCWSKNDADGDGQNWYQSTSGNTAYDGVAVAVSASWTSADGALTPDNWLITPQFNITANNLELKYWVAGQDPAYAAEHYGVFVSTTGTATTDFTQIFEETLVDTTFKEITLSLASYNGQNIYLAFRHWNITDMFQMKIDLVSIDFTSNVNNVYSNEVISVYPNPTTGVIYVNNAENTSIKVYNVLGEVVASVENASNFNTIDLGTMAKGSYIVKVISENNVVTKQVTLVK